MAAASRAKLAGRLSPLTGNLTKSWCLGSPSRAILLKQRYIPALLPSRTSRLDAPLLAGGVTGFHRPLTLPSRV